MTFKHKRNILKLKLNENKKMTNQIPEIPDTADQLLASIDDAKAEKKAADIAKLPPKVVHEIVSKERAETLKRAAGDLGGISVQPLAHEGQEYVHDNTPMGLARHGQPQLSETPVKGVVPQGHVYIETSLSQPHLTTDQLHQRADELQAQPPSVT